MNKVFGLLFGALFIFSNCWGEVEEPKFVEGHSVYVGKNTTDTSEWKVELLKNAKISVEMSCGYAGGERYLEVCDILRALLETNPNIQIHFMVSQNSGLLSKSDQKILQELKKNYPNNFKYLITDFSGLLIQSGGVYTTENHMKMLIVDEKYFQVGGTNLVDNLARSSKPDEYSPKTLQQAFLPEASSDQDVVVSGPMAKKLREDFYNVWELYKTKGSLRNSSGPLKFAKTEYFPISEEGRAVVEELENHPDLVRNVNLYATVSGPRFHYHEIGDYIMYYTMNAKSRIDIAHMYFFPVERINKELINAAKRDIAINLITNGLRVHSTTSNSTIALYAYINRANYLPIMLGRNFSFTQKDVAKKTPLRPTHVFEYDVRNNLYHKKVMVFDGRYSVVGSYNLGAKSENSDFEVNVVIDSQDVAQQLLEVLEEDKPLSEEIGINAAMDWHFSFFYNIVKAFESTFFDGIILGVEDYPREDDPRFKNLESTEFEWNKGEWNKGDGGVDFGK